MEFDVAGMTREELEARFRSLLYVRDRVAQNARLLQELHMERQELQEQNRLLYEAQGNSETTRARYLELFDFAPVAYYVFDVYGCIRGVNLTGASMFGLGREHLLGRPFALLIGVANAPAFWAHLAECRERRAAVQSELSISLKRGELAVRCVSVPVMDLSGVPSAFRTIFTNIGDLLVAREERQEAKENEQRLRLSHDRVQHATTHMHRTLRDVAGSDLDPWCKQVADEARLLVEAEHALLSISAYPSTGSTARFTSGALETDASDAQVIHQAVQYLNVNVGELLVTTRRVQGFTDDDRLRIALFAERLGFAIELARTKWLSAVRQSVLQGPHALLPVGPTSTLLAPADSSPSIGTGHLRCVKS